MEKELIEIERSKNLFLEEFKRESVAGNFLFSPNGSEIANEVVGMLKTKELTYEEAYAVLQLTYKQLKYESNFLILKGDR